MIGKLAIVCVTSDSGATNDITGVVGEWVDSISIFILLGQVILEGSGNTTAIHLCAHENYKP